MRTLSAIRIRPVSGNFESPTDPHLKHLGKHHLHLILFPVLVGTEITGLAHQLGYEREVIRIWFCNKRQALKNTVRMMSKGMV